jgi:hypothetical protein
MTCSPTFFLHKWIYERVCSIVTTDSRKDSDLSTSSSWTSRVSEHIRLTWFSGSCHAGSQRIYWVLLVKKFSDGTTLVHSFYPLILSKSLSFFSQVGRQYCPVLWIQI